LNLNEQKPDIEYPTRWQYKIIGSDVEEMLSAVAESIKGLDYEVSPSNVSKNEKYFSLNVSLIVPSEVVRDIIFQNLAKHPAIKIVI
jgi:putative lipoic acid-binding regulatory protein